MTLRYFEGCPHWRTAYDLVMRVLRDEGHDVEPRLETVATEADTKRLDFVGSPTILIGGRDPFRRPDAPYGLSCRMFQTPEGLRPTPTYEQLRDALRAARGPSTGF